MTTWRPRWLAMLVLLLVAGGAHAQATRTGTEVGFNVAGSTSVAVTVPANADLMLAFWQGYDSGAGTMASLSVNGANFTILINAYDATSGIYRGLAYLQNPSTGAQTLSWSKNTGAINEQGIGMVVYVTASNDTTPISDSCNAFSTPAETRSCNLTTASTDLAVAQVGGYLPPPNPDGTDTDQTLFLNNNASGVDYTQDGFQHDSPASGTTNMQGSGEYAAVIAVAIAQEGGGGVTQVRTLQDPSNGFGPHRSQQLNGLIQ